MIELSVQSASFAHAIHYGVVAVGLLGVLALLGPQLIGGRRSGPPRDDHALQVSALATQIASGRLGSATMPPTGVAPRSQRPVRDICEVGVLYLPVAVVGSAAAAGVHAALAPVHFRDVAAFGLFFAVVALAQSGWAIAMGFRPSRRLLVAAVGGNTALLLLWLTTRTVGLPGLMPQPEQVGLWDLSCVAWESAIVITAAQMLRAGPATDLRLATWADWTPSARLWALGSAFALPLLTLFGVGA